VKSNGDYKFHAKVETTFMEMMEKRKFNLSGIELSFTDFDTLVTPSFSDYLQ